ncbi:MAG TPA: hypothetical protein VK626_01655 [Nitrospiraceae bacterium]|nr:hypothetical protein [Nitrospiraceae bacterium]
MTQKLAARVAAVKQSAPRALPEIRQQLGALTFSPPVLDEDNRVVQDAKPIADMVRLPEGFDPATPDPLEWLPPVRHPDGTGYIRSTGNTYSVTKSFVKGVVVYTAFRGIEALHPSHATAVDAKAVADAHYQGNP